jgi:hypothetical protein
MGVGWGGGGLLGLNEIKLKWKIVIHGNQNPEGCFREKYSKVSIKRPVLLNNLVVVSWGLLRAQIQANGRLTF